jgi:hypothetical protein
MYDANVTVLTAPRFVTATVAAINSNVKQPP